jgi:hypothetical protein
MVPAARVLRAARRRASGGLAGLRRRALRARLARRGVYDRKVFCVGRNKTGTTTLEAVLNAYLFRVGPQIEAERLLVAHDEDASPAFWEWVERWEAFQDAPFSMTWCLEELWRRHPEALYIHTVRDPEQWYESLVNHHFSRMGLPRDAPRSEVARAVAALPDIVPGHVDRKNRKQFGIVSDDQLYDRELYIRNLREHDARVRDLIPARQRLEIDVSGHSDTGAICAFLGIPDALVRPMPRENRRR